MCQLLGMNCASPTDFSFSLKGFCQRGGQTDKHEHGFGLTLYQGKGIRSFHDTEAACRSALARFLLCQSIKTYNMMAHIRYATVGEVEMENVHPFTRELFGIPLSFCHNGECPRFSKQPLPRLNHSRNISNDNNQNNNNSQDSQQPYHYQPIGHTDSEAVFCSILNALREEYSDAGCLPPMPELFQFLSQLCQEIVQTQDEDDNNMPTIFNFLLACGPHTLFAYSWPGARPGSKVWNGLHYIVREPPFCKAQLVDMEEECIDFAAVTTPADRVAVVTTKPLTREAGWHEIPKGELVLFQHGQVYKQQDMKQMMNMTASNEEETTTSSIPESMPCHEQPAEPALDECKTGKQRTARLRQHQTLFSKRTPGVMMATGLLMLMLLVSLSSMQSHHQQHSMVVTASTTTTSRSAAAAAAASAILTPIENWLPSYVASTAQGTVVAAVECMMKDENSKEQQQDDDMAVLLVMQTPKRNDSSSNSKDSSAPTTEATTTINVGGLPMTHVQVAQAGTIRGDESVFPPHSGLTFVGDGGEGLVCAMTGFLPDVDYVQKHLQSHMETQRLVYNDDFNNKNGNTGNDQVAQVATLLGRVIREYEQDTDRPLGLQTLLVGWSHDDRQRFVPRFYTSDPSGQVRSWNGGGTIMGGVTAFKARQLLYQRLQDMANQETNLERLAASPVQALQATLGSLQDALFSKDEKDDAPATPQASKDAARDETSEKNTSSSKSRSPWRRRRRGASADESSSKEEPASSSPKDYEYQACLLWRSREDGTPWCGWLPADYIERQLLLEQEPDSENEEST